MGKTKALEGILKIISALVAVAMSVVKFINTIGKAKKEV